MNFTLRTAIGIALLVLGIACQIRLNRTAGEMIAAINTRLPEGERLALFGPTWQQRKIVQYHRLMFPPSRLRRKLYLWWCAEIVLYVSAVACLVRFV